MFAHHKRNPSPKTRGGKIHYRCSPAERSNTDIRLTHPRQKQSITTFAVCHAGFAHVPTDRHAIWFLDGKGLAVSFKYVFIACLAQTHALLKYPLLQQRMDASRNNTNICRSAQNLFQRVLSDKFKYIEQDLVFFLGIVNLKKRGLLIQWLTQETSRTLEHVHGTPNSIFWQGRSAPFIKHPVCGIPIWD